MLAKTKLNTVDVLISEVLIDSNVMMIFLVNNVPKEYGDMKGKIKNSNNKYVWYNQHNKITIKHNNLTELL